MNSANLHDVRWSAVNPDYESVIYDSFSRQGFSATIGATLSRVSPGVIHIDMPFSRHLMQQNGYIHAGAITTIADNACGYAALSLAPAGSEVLAVEFKINLLAPARSPIFQARARVIRKGGTLTVAIAEVFGLKEESEELIATMIETVFVRNAVGKTL